MIDSFKVEKFEVGLYNCDTITITSNKETVQIPILKSAFVANLIGKQIDIKHKDGVFDCVLDKVVFSKLSLSK